jgi:methyl-accepting chemotaxis protein
MAWKDRFSSIGARLVLGFGGLLALMCIIAATSGWSLLATGEQVRQIVEINDRRVSQARDQLDAIDAMTAAVRSIALFTDIDALKAENAKLESARRRYDEASAALETSLAGAPADARALAADIARMGHEGEAMVSVIAKQGLAGANIDVTAALTQTLPPVETAWRSKVGELIELLSRRNLEMSTSATSRTHDAALACGVLAAVSTLAGTVFAWLTVSGIRRPLDDAVRVAERIAAGSLDSPVHPAGASEIRRLLGALGEMQSRLRDLVWAILDAASNLQIASAEVAAGNADLSRRTEHAAARLQGASSAAERLSSDVRHGVDASSKASELAREAAEIAATGGQVVDKVVSTMSRISASSKRMADIIGVIDAIAFQTNVLALNAAVEAARAGDLGRGFAVVASEVRSLAGRSASAAREIGELIESSLGNVDEGATLVREAGGAMGRIVVGARHVSELIGEVSETARQQSARVDEISLATIEIDKATQQNAALVEQSAAAADSLREQADRLAHLVTAFELGGRTAADNDVGAGLECRPAIAL